MLFQKLGLCGLGFSCSPGSSVEVTGFTFTYVNSSLLSGVQSVYDSPLMTWVILPQTTQRPKSAYHSPPPISLAQSSTILIFVSSLSLFSAAMAEFFDRLLRGRDEVSRVLLDGRPITRLVGFSSSGADPHRHGRMVMCVNTDAGSFFYKPHDCKLDALYLELVGTWFSDCVRAACLVEGEGHAFVERLVPEGLANEAELRTYWHNLGCLTALFHSLGSRDMTHDNLMCCGTRPAVLDLETLLTAEVPFDKEMLAGEASAWGVPADKVASTVICTSILPDPTSRLAVSPLIEDNASGSCLPRVCGEPHTVKGHEKSFLEGFEEGYRRIMRHRKEVLATIARNADATCRQILLNTYAYARSRALLFSPGAMANPVNRDEVLAGLVNSYAAFSPELRRAVAAPDALALAEGDIPYYCSHASARTLYDGDGRAVGDFLSRSALEVASSRIGSFSEEDSFPSALLAP